MHPGKEKQYACQGLIDIEGYFVMSYFLNYEIWKLNPARKNPF